MHKTLLTLFITILFGSFVNGQEFEDSAAQEDSVSEAPAKSPRLKKKVKKSNSENSQAKTKRKVKKKKSSSSRDAEVKTDGAAVYEATSFDSPVLEYFDKGKKIKVSKKLYPGIGIGAFYKVKLSNKTYGFITDTDVLLSGKGNSGSSLTGSKPDQGEAGNEASGSASGDPFLDQSLMDDRPEQETNTNTGVGKPYIGLAYYTFNYAEKLGGKNVSSNTSLLGLKASGSTPYFGGFPLDINILFTTSAPEFYDKVSSTSGVMLIGDAVVMLPLVETSRYYVFYGFGLVTRYSKWDVKLKNQPGKPAVDSQEWAIGLAAAGGFAFNITKTLAFHADGRYYLEKKSYPGFGVAIQFKY